MQLESQNTLPPQPGIRAALRNLQRLYKEATLGVTKRRIDALTVIGRLIPRRVGLRVPSSPEALPQFTRYADPVGAIR